MKNPIITEIIVLLFIMLFLYTGISKLMEYDIFKEQLAASPILAPFAFLLARGLPITEFILTLLLIVPRWRLKGLLGSTFLMTIFTIYIITTMLFADYLPCSCGGLLVEFSWVNHILFNSTFIMLGILGILGEKKIRKKFIQERKLIGTQPNAS